MTTSPPATDRPQHPVVEKQLANPTQYVKPLDQAD